MDTSENTTISSEFIQGGELQNDQCNAEMNELNVHDEGDQETSINNIETENVSDDDLHINFSQVNFDDEKPAEDTSPQKKRKRRWKPRKRKWKPYYKLSWKEKRELEDREGRRATRIRAERFAHGQPVAPYNTTQFLMEDHNVKEPDLNQLHAGHRQHRESTNVESSEEFYSSPEDEEEFLQKEFTEIYDSIHAERLNSMSKSELIQEYIQLEDKVDKLEQKLKFYENEELIECGDKTELDSPDSKSVENKEKVRIFQDEIQKLIEQNKVLREENNRLANCTENDCVFITHEKEL